METVRLDYNIILFKDESFLLDHSSGFLLPIEPQFAKIFEQLSGTLSLAKVNELENVFPKRTIEEALGKLFSLIEAGFLVRAESQATTLKIARMHVAGSCNMACEYCFEKEMQPSMRLEVAHKTIDFLFQSSNEKEIKVVFFGGEPLTEFALVKEIVAYGRRIEKKIPERKIRFAISTNGTLLKKKTIDFLCEQDFGMLVSYDGPTHRRFRRMKDGKATHELVRNNIRKVAQSFEPERLAIAATVHHYNRELPGVIESIIDLGVKNIKLSFEKSQQSEFCLIEEDYEYLAQQTENIFDICKKNPDINIEHYSLHLNADGSFRCCHGCSACRVEITIDTHGDIYPCSLFIGNRAFVLGNIEQQSFDRPRFEQIAGTLNRRKNNCSLCQFRRICGGHCPYESLLLFGNIENLNSSKCKLFKRISEEKIKYYLERFYCKKS